MAPAMKQLDSGRAWNDDANGIPSYDRDGAIERSIYRRTSPPGVPEELCGKFSEFRGPGVQHRSLCVVLGLPISLQCHYSTPTRVQSELLISLQETKHGLISMRILI